MVMLKVKTLFGADSDRSLLTGGRCSELLVNTGLTLHFLFLFSQLNI
jgi:hypothetical protein